LLQKGGAEHAIAWTLGGPEKPLGCHTARVVAVEFTHLAPTKTDREDKDKIIDLSERMQKHYGDEMGLYRIQRGSLLQYVAAKNIGFLKNHWDVLKDQADGLIVLLTHGKDRRETPTWSRWNNTRKRWETI
jgi:hypothetical protein